MLKLSGFKDMNKVSQYANASQATDIHSWMEYINNSYNQQTMVVVLQQFVFFFTMQNQG
jgi:hypothetical protein